jgi:hypothetical protein
MVHTSSHKPPGPKALKTHPTVTYWKINEGLVLESPAHCPSATWPFGWQGK